MCVVLAHTTHKFGKPHESPGPIDNPGIYARFAYRMCD